MNKEEALELREATELLVQLRVARDALNARITELESAMNHMVGIDALTEKLYSDLLKVKVAI